MANKQEKIFEDKMVRSIWNLETEQSLFVRPTK